MNQRICLPPVSVMHSGPTGPFLWTVARKFDVQHIFLAIAPDTIVLGAVIGPWIEL